MRLALAVLFLAACTADNPDYSEPFARWVESEAPLPPPPPAPPPAVRDMASAPDAATVPDLAMAPDLCQPPDLVQCEPAKHAAGIMSGQFGNCGCIGMECCKSVAEYASCPSGNGFNAPRTCVRHLGGNGRLTCEACGQLGEPCCGPYNAPRPELMTCAPNLTCRRRNPMSTCDPSEAGCATCQP